MMESTPSRANRDTILDVNLFSENLAEVSNWKTKVFAFLFFISIALLALKLHLRRIITKNYTTTSIRMLLFGLVSTNVHLPSHTHLGPDYMANFSPVTRAEILARLLKQIHLKSNWRYMEKDSDEQTSKRAWESEELSARAEKRAWTCVFGILILLWFAHKFGAETNILTQAEIRYVIGTKFQPL